MRKFFERGAADDGNGVVGREIAEIVFESDEVERVDEAVGGIAGDDIDLMIDESAVEKAEVHDVRSGGEMEGVPLAPAGEAVGALEEFVADADAPFGSYGREIGHGAEMETLGVFAADNHGKGVFETERFSKDEIEALGILLFDAIIDLRGRVRAGRFVEDGGEGGAGVLDVKIDIAGEESFVDEESAAEIGFAVDGDSGAGFDVLGEKFREDNLLGEKFGADDEMRWGWFAAGRG